MGKQKTPGGGPGVSGKAACGALSVYAASSCPGWRAMIMMAAMIAVGFTSGQRARRAVACRGRIPSRRRGSHGLSRSLFRPYGERTAAVGNGHDRLQRLLVGGDVNANYDLRTPARAPDRRRR